MSSKLLQFLHFSLTFTHFSRHWAFDSCSWMLIGDIDFVQKDLIFLCKMFILLLGKNQNYIYTGKSFHMNFCMLIPVNLNKNRFKNQIKDSISLKLSFLQEIKTSIWISKRNHHWKKSQLYCWYFTYHFKSLTCTAWLSVVSFSLLSLTQVSIFHPKIEITNLLRNWYLLKQ